MRIHRLEIQAFGPFAERQVIDFDELGEQGLFLLNGPTGAGKTSVLDAICYALYGTVPGTRQGGKRLRSDHAPEGLEPQVVCEFSSGGRWMEVVRSPAWERPAKRGAGTTTQNARTLLREKENGSWTEKSIRADEAGSEISALLGMNMDQFTKVVLLAQGDFAAFLRAKADDRQELLQKLFGTELYENVEKQLAAEAAAAKEELAGKEQQLWQLEESARAQAADIAAPDQGPDSVPAAGRPTGQDAGAVRRAEDEARGERFFEVLLERLADACGRAQKAAAARHQDRLASAAACVSAQELMSRHQKLRTAVAERDRLAGLVPQFEQWQQRAQEHREAEVLAGQLAALSASRERLAGAETTAARIRALLAADEQTLALAGLGGPAGGTGVLSVADLRGAQSRLDREGAVVEADLPAEDRLDSLRAELAVLSDEVRDARDAAAKHAEAADAAQAQCQALRPGVEGLRELAGAVAAREQASTGAAQLLETIEAFGRARAQAAACDANHLQDHERLLNARELWLSLVERRLESAAGEMAARLVDGEPCQVCGSAVHPRPSALAGAGLEAAEAEEQAKIARDRAEAAEAGSAAKLAAARQELAVLQGRGGDADAGSARQAAEDAAVALAAAAEAAAQLDQRESELAALTVRIQEQESLASACRERAAVLEAQRTAAQTAAEQLDAKLAAARGGFGTLGERLAQLHRAAELVDKAAAAIQSLDAAAAETATAQAALEAALPQTPFSDASAARAALLPAAESRALAERIRGFTDSLVRSEAAFEHDDVKLAAVEAEQGTAAPTEELISGLRAAAEAASEAANAAAVHRELVEKALRSVRTAGQRYAALAAEAAPLREHFQRVSAIAETARGRGENNYKMTLNAYVLAARLEQVAVAASQRLGTMSDGRYTLSHSDALAGRNQKSGLGLEVVDQWTGQRRDTATLSGGESFMASLALALGLADVVQQEAGGVDIETLFVDEGFGSLDEESLEQVMDALEGLRDGGRVVGLVSHVAEMKLRIPTQLQVRKGRTGSTLSINHAAGVVA